MLRKKKKPSSYINKDGWLIRDEEQGLDPYVNVAFNMIKIGSGINGLGWICKQDVPRVIKMLSKYIDD